MLKKSAAKPRKVTAKKPGTKGLRLKDGEYHPEQIRQAIIDAKGLLSYAADRLGCTRKTIYNHIQRYPELGLVVEEAREKNVDFAEGALLKKLQGGDTTGIIFFLKTQAKHRGYVERTESLNLEDANKLATRVAEAVRLFVPQDKQLEAMRLITNDPNYNA